MTLQAKSYEVRVKNAPPEALVQGWPKDYWAGYQHPRRQEQLKLAYADPCRRRQEWMRGQSKEQPGFLFYGPPGYGKTATVLMLGLMASRRGFLVRFTTAEHLAAQRESTAFNAREGRTSGSLLEEYLAPDVLILDDVVTRTYAPTVRAFIFDLIRERKSLGRVTDMTTNAELRTTTGQDAFSNSLDGRALSTYTGWAYDAEDWKVEGQMADTLRAAR